MKQRRKKRKSCRSKIAHSSRDHAMIALKKLQKTNFIFHKMRPYKCKFCGKWHIGRTNKILYEKFDELKNKW
jgi:hypothetical protein